MASKFIFVVGGVYSGTGKGIGAASLGLLLKMRGAKVNLMKCDPYLNINAGTMNPRQHGEVFLCDDGSETDLDLGHYERLAGVNVTGKNIFTSGSLYKEILAKEEKGDFLGETVQIVPHVTNYIQDRLIKAGKGHDITIAEIGGTVGDFESGCFYEAINQFKQRNPKNVMITMVAPIIWNNTVKEYKTKPLQNAVRELRHSGLIPEMLFCRCDREIPSTILDKVSRLTGVDRGAVFEAPDVPTIYQVPIEFYNRHVDDFVADRFELPRKGVRIRKYRDLVEKYLNAEDLPTVNIAIVGKYDNHDEAYLSLKESVMHAGVKVGVNTNIEWVNAEELEDVQDLRGVRHRFKDIQGIIVPGGFDIRAVDGKIKAIQYAREKQIPYLGICLGLQCAVIEFSRNVMGWKNATSREFIKNDDDSHRPVIELVKGQKGKTNKSGTMRLGAFDCELKKDSLARKAYGKKIISERHRHHYEVNDRYLEDLASKGLVVSGTNPQKGLVEVMELKDHPYFIGTQAHPEFKSRLDEPAPLFVGLIEAARKMRANEEV